MHGEGFGLMPKPRWMYASSTPRQSRRCTCPDLKCVRHGYDRTLRGKRTEVLAKRDVEGGRMLPHDAQADPDGFAVYGRYPRGFLRHVLKLRLLGDVARGDVLHVCSGTLSASERWTVDVRAEARPRVQASGAALPFRDASFKAVMLDPPYSDTYARSLYGVDNPRPSHLLREAARVVAPGGRIGILHVAIPFAPAGAHLVRVYPVSTGVGFRIRAFTIYERAQAGLL